MSVSPAQLLPATAGYPKSLHGLGYALENDNRRNDEASNDDMLFVAANRLLLDVESEPVIAIPEVFGSEPARTVDVLHNGRFDKCNAHGISSQRESVSLPLRRANHCPNAYTMGTPRNVEVQAQNVTKHRKFSVAAASERLAQIAGEGSGNTIGQNKPINDPVFIAVRDPSDKPDLAIDALDIDASGENVGNDNRLGQRVFIHHHFSGVAA